MLGTVGCLTSQAAVVGWLDEVFSGIGRSFAPFACICCQFTAQATGTGSVGLGDGLVGLVGSIHFAGGGLVGTNFRGQGSFMICKAFWYIGELWTVDVLKWLFGA